MAWGRLGEGPLSGLVEDSSPMSNMRPTRSLLTIPKNRARTEVDKRVRL